MISLVGMLPFGFSSFKVAMNNTVESQIVQNLSNDITLAGYSSLSTYAAPMTWYYDFQGEALGTSTNGVAPTNAVYVAKVTVIAVDGTNSPAALTSATAASSVTIQITSLSDNSAYTAQHPHQYSLIIANNGR